MTIERAGGGRRGVKRSFDDVYDSFLDEWAFERSQVFGARAQRGAEMATEPPGGVADRVRTIYRDAMTYLPENILCKVDRGAMAVSLETRVPVLRRSPTAMGAAPSARRRPSRCPSLGGIIASQFSWLAPKPQF